MGEPHRIDRRVGENVKRYRTLQGISQERLGEVVDVTFQQIQKYEKGTNRIAPSKLYTIAQFLGVPIANFYEDRLGVELAELDGADQLEEFQDISAHDLRLAIKIGKLPTEQKAKIMALVEALG